MWWKKIKDYKIILPDNKDNNNNKAALALTIILLKSPLSTLSVRKNQVYNSVKTSAAAILVSLLFTL